MTTNQPPSLAEEMLKGQAMTPEVKDMLEKVKARMKQLSKDDQREAGNEPVESV